MRSNHNHPYPRRRQQNTYNKPFNDSDIYENEFVKPDDNINNEKEYKNERDQDFYDDAGDKIKNAWENLSNDALDYENDQYNPNFEEYKRDEEDKNLHNSNNKPSRDQHERRFRDREAHKDYNSVNENDYKDYDRGKNEFSTSQKTSQQKRRRKRIHR
jgi:hypothetical protein